MMYSNGRRGPGFKSRRMQTLSEHLHSPTAPKSVVKIRRLLSISTVVTPTWSKFLCALAMLTPLKLSFQSQNNRPHRSFHGIRSLYTATHCPDSQAATKGLGGILWKFALMLTRTIIGATGGPVVKTIALYSKCLGFESRRMQTMSERLQLLSL